MEQNRKCLCRAANCAKCLGGGCTSENCLIHTKARKEAFKNRTTFYVVPQTQEEIERNRKQIEKLRATGLLKKYEKTFRFLDDGTVMQDDEEEL